MRKLETTYDWQQPYTAAIWETDNRLIKGRVCLALSTLERRRLSPVEPDSDEDRALASAETGLRLLITEGTGKPV
jgi:hypothetical protein